MRPSLDSFLELFTLLPHYDAGDTVLLSNSGDQLTRILHLIQFHGFCRGLYLNEEKYQHLRYTQIIVFTTPPAPRIHPAHVPHAQDSRGQGTCVYLLLFVL